MKASGEMEKCMAQECCQIQTVKDMKEKWEWSDVRTRYLVEKEEYEGAFLNGKMHGEGVLNLNDGRVFKVNLKTEAMLAFPETQF